MPILCPVTALSSVRGVVLGGCHWLLIPFLTSPSFSSVSSAAGRDALPLPCCVPCQRAWRGSHAFPPPPRSLPVPPSPRPTAAVAWDSILQGLSHGGPSARRSVSVSLAFGHEPLPVSRDFMDPLNRECIKSMKKVGG